MTFLIAIVIENAIAPLLFLAQEISKLIVTVVSHGQRI